MFNRTLSSLQARVLRFAAIAIVMTFSMAAYSQEAPAASKTVTTGHYTITSGKITASGSATVDVHGKAEAELSGGAQASCYDESSCDGKDNAVVRTFNKATGSCHGNGACLVIAHDESTAFAFDHTSMVAADRAEGHLHDSASGSVFGNAVVAVNDACSVVAFDHATIDGRESLVALHGSVELFGDAVLSTSQIRGPDDKHKSPEQLAGKRPTVKIHDNARWFDYESYGHLRVVDKNGEL